MQRIRQVLPVAETQIARNSNSPDCGHYEKPQPEPQKNASNTPRRAARHKDMAEWFWWLVEEMVRLRGCHVSPGYAREKYILLQLEARKFSSADATAAEQHILYGTWRSEKTLRVGLELTDFYPEAITVSRQEFESMRQRMYYALLAQLREELQQSARTVERTDEEQGVIEEYRKAMVKLHMELQKANDEAQRDRDRARELVRELHSAGRRIARQQTRLVVTNDELSALGRSIAELQRQNTELQQENAALRAFGTTENPTETDEFWDVFEDEPDGEVPFPVRKASKTGA